MAARWIVELLPHRWVGEWQDESLVAIRPMTAYLSISFVTGLTLEELATRVGLNPVEFDAENEYEWALGTLGALDDIDIARTHLVPPSETRTSVCRYTSDPDRSIPIEVIRCIYAALHDVATEFEVHGTNAAGVCFKRDAESL